MNKKPYIIAETAYNHEGDIDYLYKMMDSAKDAKANAIKIHLIINMESLFQKNHPGYNVVDNMLFSKEQFKGIFNYINKELNLDSIALCHDLDSVKFANEELDVDGIELHAVASNDIEMLEEVSKFKGEIAIATGGYRIDEVDFVVRFLKERGVSNILLLYGHQGWPATRKNINLSRMLLYRELFGVKIGYADHLGWNDPNNVYISSLPSCMGFNIIEKHFTIEEGEERVDSVCAVGKNKLLEIRKMMEIALDTWGNNSLILNKEEKKFGMSGLVRKAIIARDSIKKGDEFNYNNLTFKRCSRNTLIRPLQILDIIGNKANINIKKGEIIESNMVMM